MECIGVKADGRLAYVTSHPSEEDYVEQMEDAEDIADITFHRSRMIDEDGGEIDVELFAADDYVRE